jgi:pimeloyl-ACP methyl ester carboxylesterase
MSRKVRIILMLVLLAGVFGYRQLRDRAPQAAPGTSAAAITVANPALKYGQLAFKPCALSSPLQSVEAQCATLSVPENHDAPAGDKTARRIDLAVAWIPAKGEAEPDPIVMIAGGPGQSALQTYPMIDAAFADARRSRHVILLDARGTGDSHPLKCTTPETDDPLQDPMGKSPEAARVFAERCRDELAKTSDLRRYATTDHIRDLDLLRTKLGVEQLNLVGVSYGTRVAQQYAKRYPAHTRLLVLDSVAPNSLVLGQSFARNLESALKLQFTRCVADAACKAQLGDPSRNLATVRERLKAGNLAPVRYRDPTTGEWRSDAPQFDHLAVLLRMYAYQPQAAAMLPLLLHDAAEGRYEGLLAQSRMLVGDVSDSMMIGMQLSVICTEDAADLRDDPTDADTVLGTDLVAFSMAQCAVWPKGERPAGFREPLAGKVPVLAISGEFDPVTPPRYGDEAIKSLPNGRHLVLPGQGHNVIGAGCMPKLFAQFVETADAKALDAACLERLKPTPPFAGNYGWEP